MWQSYLMLVRYYLTTIAVMQIPTAASLAFSSYPTEAEIGQVYSITWKEATGIIDLYFISAKPYGTQDFVYNGYNNEVSWSPRNDLSLKYSFYFLLMDYNTGENITTSPIFVTQATTTDGGSSTTLESSSSTQTSSSSSSVLQSYYSEPTPTPTSSPNSTPDTSDTQIQLEKLGNGAIVGISIGSAGLILLLIIAVLLYRRQRQRRVPEEREVEKIEINVAKSSSLHDHPQVEGRPISYELSGNPDMRSVELASHSG